ncbi:MAG TPA: methyltransferase domain-containing protein [Bryobacteraceae bacterium]|nr:methyltransferase domain-containing protein [Bryobacteraceae bacterium]
MSGAATLKSCCAAVYQSDFARLLLGDSFHPGGLALTERIGELLALSPADHLLDVASGRGESAISLAGRFGCRVTGVDFGESNIAYATSRSEATNVAALVQFEIGDAEQLHFPDAVFDAVFCECAFCTFPDKRAAAREFVRVLRPGGRLGLSDLTRSGALPPELEGLLAWIACIGDARHTNEYVECLAEAGFDSITIEPHDDALARMLRDIQGRLLAAELMVKLEKINLSGVDFREAKTMAACAADAIRSGLLGYTVIAAKKPCG